MANMASVAYAIEGSDESLNKIYEAILKAMSYKNCWTEYKACELLGYTEEELNDLTSGYSLGGAVEEKPTFNKKTGVLKFFAEERWGLQNFHELLKKKFPDIKVYWVVEEVGFDVFCTNDKEGKYFPARYWVDMAQDDVFQSDYFKTEKAMYKWLDKVTYGRVKSEEDVEEFNADYEDSGACDENFIYIHKFEVEED